MPSKHTLIGVVSGVAAVAAMMAAFGIYVRGVNRQATVNLQTAVALARDDYEEIAKQQQIFGDFTTQDVTSYILALKARMRLLLSEKELIRAEQNLTNNSDVIIIKDARIAEIDSELAELGVEADFMNYVHFDWTRIQTKEETKTALTEFWKYWANRSWPVVDDSEDKETMEPVYIDQGQLIGLQGCSGVCSGTHLHFVTIFDNQYRDPCNLLPLRRFSKWGVQSECGTALKTDLIWPQIGSWLITQEFGDVSPITRTVHNAIDVIDRVEAPVIAAHSGWYYNYFRSCAGAYVCNDQTKVA